MTIHVDEKGVKHGVLTLVLGLAEILHETLIRESVRRMDAGSLTPDEVERLGTALQELEDALHEIEAEHGIIESVAELRRGLDDVADEVVDKLVNPERWVDEARRSDGDGK